MNLIWKVASSVLNPVIMNVASGFSAVCCLFSSTLDVVVVVWANQLDKEIGFYVYGQFSDLCYFLLKDNCYWNVYAFEPWRSWLFCII